jgi:hypothetical protein
MAYDLWSIVAAAAIAAAVPAAAQTERHLGKNLPTRAAVQDERITMPRFPSGWDQFPLQQGAIEVVEYVPKGQSPADWREKITLEVHHETNTMPVDVYQRRAVMQMRENCTGVVEGRLQSGVNNGFPSAFWTLGCRQDRRSKLGETRYTKVVQGTRTLYVLSRAWRTEPFGDAGPPLTKPQVDEAITFLTSSVVCANNADHPCPAEGK